MSSDHIEIGYRKGRFPRSGIHSLVISQIRRLRPEVPSHWVDKFGESLVKSHTKIGFPISTVLLAVLTFLTMGIGLPLLILAIYAQVRWGNRGNPNRMDRLVVNSKDLEMVLAKDQVVSSVAVYADALHAVMGAELEEPEYKELSNVLLNLLQSEREAKEKRISLEEVYDRMSNHDPVQALEVAQGEFDRTINAATRQVIENQISVLEKQRERREHLRNHIEQLQAQESLAIELMRSMGESALQLDTIPYVAITPILNNARDLVYNMDHEVLAFERAVVEMEVEPYKLNLSLGST